MMSDEEILNGTAADEASEEYRYLRSLNQSLVAATAGLVVIEESDDDGKHVGQHQAQTESGSPLLWDPAVPSQRPARSQKPTIQNHPLFTSTPLETGLQQQQSAFSIFQLSQPFSSSLPPPLPTQSSQPVLINDGRLGFPINPTPPQPSADCTPLVAAPQAVAAGSMTTEFHLSIPNHFNEDGSVLPLNQVLHQSSQQQQQLAHRNHNILQSAGEFRVPEAPLRGVGLHVCNGLLAKTPKHSQTPRMDALGIMGGSDEFGQTPSAMRELLRQQPLLKTTPAASYGRLQSFENIIISGGGNKTMVLASDTPLLPRHLHQLDSPDDESALNNHGNLGMNASKSNPKTSENTDRSAVFPCIRVAEQTPPDLCSFDPNAPAQLVKMDCHEVPIDGATAEKNFDPTSLAANSFDSEFRNTPSSFDRLNLATGKDGRLSSSSEKDQIVVFVAESPQLPEERPAADMDADFVGLMLSEHGQPQDLPLSGESIVISQSQEPAALRSQEVSAAAPTPFSTDPNESAETDWSSKEVSVDEPKNVAGDSTEEAVAPRLSLAYETSQCVDFSAVQVDENSIVENNSPQQPPVCAPKLTTQSSPIISTTARSPAISSDRFTEFLAKRGKFIIQTPVVSNKRSAGSTSAPVTTASSPQPMREVNTMNDPDNTQETVRERSPSPIREGMIRHTISRLESGVQRQLSVNKSKSLRSISAIPFIVESQDQELEDESPPMIEDNQEQPLNILALDVLKNQDCSPNRENIRPPQTPASAGRLRMRIDSDSADDSIPPLTSKTKNSLPRISSPSKVSLNNRGTGAPSDYRILQRVWASREGEDYYRPATVHSLHLDHAVVSFANRQHGGTVDVRFESLRNWQLAVGDTVTVMANDSVDRRMFITANIPADNENNERLFVVADLSANSVPKILRWTDLILSHADLAFSDAREQAISRIGPDEAPPPEMGIQLETAPKTPNPNFMLNSNHNTSSKTPGHKRRQSSAMMTVELNNNGGGDPKSKRRRLHQPESAILCASQISSAVCESPSVLALQRRHRKIFEGYLFLLTAIDSNDENSSVQFRKRLEDAGGEVWEIGDFERIKCKRSIKQRLLLASKPCRTTKYFLALASEIPRVHISWAHECMDQITILDYNKYLLPNGECADCEAVSSSSSSSSRKSRIKRIPQYSRSNILHGRLLYLHGAGAEKEAWSLIVKQAGGQVALKKTAPNIDYFVIFEESKTSASLTAIKPANELTAVVRKEWLFQSLIRQELLPANDPKFCLHTSRNNNDCARAAAAKSNRPGRRRSRGYK